MSKQAKSSVAATVRTCIEREGEGYYRPRDFQGLETDAVLKAFSRLAKEGFIERKKKGLYYRSRMTVLGPSTGSRTELHKLSVKEPIHPSGLTASHHLGFTTQVPSTMEYATASLHAPQLDDTHIVIHARRPPAWRELTTTDAALLSFLRDRARTSDLSPEDTIERLCDLLSERGRFLRLAGMVEYEPPRVRAMLGAIGEEIGAKPSVLKKLKASLNPFSRFDFGVLHKLKYAKEWQAQ